MALDPLVTHAREFTNIEVEGLTVWNAVQDLGTASALQLARELLDAVLMAEHYTSVLPHSPADRTADQTKTLDFLRREMDDKLQQGRALLHGGDKPPTTGG